MDRLHPGCKFFFEGPRQEPEFFAWRDGGACDDDSFAQTALGAQTIECASDGAGVLAEFGGFAFEASDLFEHFDWDQNPVFLEAEEGVWIVEENVRVENVIFHCADDDLISVMRLCQAFN